MKFLLIIVHDDEFRPTAELLAEIHAWITETTKKKLRVYGNPLQPADTAMTVRIRDAKQEVYSSTFSQSKEQICAYELIDCETQEDAVALALTHPMAKAATIEVRPIWSALSG